MEGLELFSKNSGFEETFKKLCGTSALGCTLLIEHPLIKAYLEYVNPGWQPCTLKLMDYHTKHYADFASGNYYLN